MRHSRKLSKTLKYHIVQGSGSFKVFDVDTIQKLVTSGCYDKQHVCAYLCHLVAVVLVLSPQSVFNFLSFMYYMHALPLWVMLLFFLLQFPLLTFCQYYLIILSSVNTRVVKTGH